MPADTAVPANPVATPIIAPIISLFFRQNKSNLALMVGKRGPISLSITIRVATLLRNQLFPCTFAQEVVSLSLRFS
jgi:hypothetical protein